MKKKELLHEFLMLTLGTTIVALGVYFFKFPNHFSTGGVTGLAILLSAVLPVSSSIISSVLNVAFLILGFIFLNRGFGARTIYCSLLAGQLVDRGLLILPFCPLYGLTIGVIDWLIGTPLEGGMMLNKIQSGAKRFVLYFLLATLIPTVAEFLTGLFFDGLLGVRLWYYAEQPFTLMGYVCLQVSLLWGILLTTFMLFGYPFIRKVISMIPRKPAFIIAAVTSSLVILNLAFFFVRIIPKVFQ